MAAISYSDTIRPVATYVLRAAWLVAMIKNIYTLALQSPKNEIIKYEPNLYLSESVPVLCLNILSVGLVRDSVRNRINYIYVYILLIQTTI